MTVSCITLITSAAFVGQELVAEFGLLPPSFLPLGVGRVYETQINNLRQSSSEASHIYLTVPESFNIASYDKRILKEKGLTILPIPDDMQLGESIIYALNIINAYNSSVRILHGDTILGEIPSEMDIIGSHIEGDDYSWAVINYTGDIVDSLETIEPTRDNKGNKPVACGYFAFSNGIELIRALNQARGNFVKGINLYAQRQPMKVKPVKEWYDFGHIQTYFHSRRMVTTARAFNSLQITRNTVKKLSADSFKMMAETKWLSEAPPVLQPYTARILDCGEENGRSFYSTEYQYAPNLSELYVFSEIGRVTWNKILTSCIEFVEICASINGDKPRDEYSRQLMGDKTVQRLETFAKETGFNIEQELVFNNRPMPSLSAIAQQLEQFITYDPTALSTVMHGDFCFSNILYNSRNSRISAIDPRGYIFPKTMEIYGDFRYDIAKLSHSIDGLYDFIIAGRYDLTQDSYHFNLTFNTSMHRQWLQKSFGEINIAGISASSMEIRAMTISLFLSMLPLHSDRPDRQNAFIANALRLYSEFEGKK